MTQNISTYQIQHILDQTLIHDKPHYLIKWKGYSSTQSTWQPIQNLIQSLDIVHLWKIQHSLSKNYICKDNYVNINKKNQLNQCCNKNQIIKQKGKLKNKTNPNSEYIIIDSDQVANIDPYKQLQKQLQTNQYSLGQHSLPKIPKKAKSTNRCQIRKQQITHQQLNKKNYNNGLKVIGKIQTKCIKSVTWCFLWEDQQICSVLLTNGKTVNMLKADVKNSCPNKLLDYYEKLLKTRR